MKILFLFYHNHGKVIMLLCLFYETRQISFQFFYQLIRRQIVVFHDEFA